MRVLLLTSVMTMLLSACAPQIQLPAGFAPQHQSGDQRALTPQGSVLKFREINNDPYADVHFWNQALTTHLVGAGYAPKMDSVIQTQKGDTAHFSQWVVPMQGGDYLYVVGLIARDKKIYLLESMGPWQDMESNSSGLLQALDKFNSQ